MKKNFKIITLMLLLPITFFVMSCRTTGGGGDEDCTDDDQDDYYEESGCGTLLDCDDNDNTIHPGATESCDQKDNNCNGTIDEGCTTCTDSDSDGYYGQPGCGTQLDCNDSNFSIHPGAVESCDGKDNNCNGIIDEGCTGCSDLDSDGYYSASGCGTQIDCNDYDSAIHPGAAEICDTKDNDCDTQIDEGCYSCVDADFDGYFAQPGCGTALDCNDSDLLIHPNAFELCDLQDNDCDGLVDEGCAGCIDLDMDGYYSTAGCGSAVDCNDLAPLIHPGVLETCDGQDNNCDGNVDEGCGSQLAVQVSAGAYHTCALNATGGVWCWGWNYRGQLGNGTNIDSNVPVGVYGLSTGAVYVSAGGHHSCILNNLGGVECWGNNDYGELGDGTTVSSNVPVAVKDPNDITGYLTGVVAISSGEYHTCALKNDGSVWCWGNNNWAQLGTDLTVLYSTVPLNVFGLGAGTTLAISSGYEHSCALTVAGPNAIKCWGNNYYGQLGDSSNIFRRTPVDVTGLAGILQVSAGAQHTCAITGANAGKCWGHNESGELGMDLVNWYYNSPQDVINPLTDLPLGGITKISAGWSHTCAIVSDGAKCWGDNRWGEVGDNSPSSYKEAPVDVFGLTTGIVDISAGWGHSCAVTSSGAVKCWGDNKWGQLGNGTNNLSRIPVSVSSFGP